MADDINMTTIMAPLNPAASIRRVKQTDPENERRPPEDQQQKGKKRQKEPVPGRPSAAVEVALHKASPDETETVPGTRGKKQKSSTQADVTEKTIDVRV